MTDHPEAVEQAWRIHAALVDWTGKVDSKASFTLTIQSAVLAGIVTLTGTGHHLHGLRGATVDGFFWVGIAVLILGVLASASVVAPRVRRNKMGEEWRQNFIFFGHLKDWEPDDLTAALSQRDILPVLSRQLVVMSKIAWQKHEQVQISMWSGAFGTLLVFVAYALK